MKINSINALSDSEKVLISGGDICSHAADDYKNYNCLKLCVDKVFLYSNQTNNKNCKHYNKKTFECPDDVITTNCFNGTYHDPFYRFAIGWSAIVMTLVTIFAAIKKSTG